MEKFIEFFKKNNCGFLATSENNMPKVRPWSFLFEEDGKIWFMTTNTKRVFQQLKDNPYIEFCSYSGSIHGRLSGKIEFYNNLEIKYEIIESRPLLKEIYKTHTNPLLETFYLEHGTASLYSSRLGLNEYIEF